METGGAKKERGLALEFIHSTAILFRSNGVHYDRHETVIDTAQFAALTVVSSDTIDEQAHLI
jgi:hypothetical protein